MISQNIHTIAHFSTTPRAAVYRASLELDEGCYQLIHEIMTHGLDRVNVKVIKTVYMNGQICRVYRARLKQDSYDKRLTFMLIDGVFAIVNYQSDHDGVYKNNDQRLNSSSIKKDAIEIEEVARWIQEKDSKILESHFKIIESHEDQLNTENSSYHISFDEKLKQKFLEKSTFSLGKMIHPSLEKSFMLHESQMNVSASLNEAMKGRNSSQVAIYAEAGCGKTTLAVEHIITVIENEMMQQMLPLDTLMTALTLNQSLHDVLAPLSAWGFRVAFICGGAHVVKEAQRAYDHHPISQIARHVGIEVQFIHHTVRQTPKPGQSELPYRRKELQYLIKKSLPEEQHGAVSEYDTNLQNMYSQRDLVQGKAENYVKIFSLPQIAQEKIFYLNKLYPDFAEKADRYGIEGMDDNLDDAQHQSWDLMVIDEAHNFSAYELMKLSACASSVLYLLDPYQAFLWAGLPNFDFFKKIRHVRLKDCQGVDPMIEFELSDQFRNPEKIQTLSRNLRTYISRASENLNRSQQQKKNRAETLVTEHVSQENTLQRAPGDLRFFENLNQITALPQLNAILNHQGMRTLLVTKNENLHFLEENYPDCDFILSDTSVPGATVSVVIIDGVNWDALFMMNEQQWKKFFDPQSQENHDTVSAAIQEFQRLMMLVTRATEACWICWVSAHEQKEHAKKIQQPAFNKIKKLIQKQIKNGLSYQASDAELHIAFEDETTFAQWQAEIERLLSQNDLNADESAVRLYQRLQSRYPEIRSISFQEAYPGVSMIERKDHSIKEEHERNLKPIGQPSLQKITAHSEDAVIKKSPSRLTPIEPNHHEEMKKIATATYHRVSSLYSSLGYQPNLTLKKNKVSVIHALKEVKPEEISALFFHPPTPDLLSLVENAFEKNAVAVSILDEILKKMESKIGLAFFNQPYMLHGIQIYPSTLVAIYELYSIQNHQEFLLKLFKNPIKKAFHNTLPDVIQSNIQSDALKMRHFNRFRKDFDLVESWIPQFDITALSLMSPSDFSQCLQLYYPHDLFMTSSGLKKHFQSQCLQYFQEQLKLAQYDQIRLLMNMFRTLNSDTSYYSEAATQLFNQLMDRPTAQKIFSGPLPVLDNQPLCNLLMSFHDYRFSCLVTVTPNQDHVLIQAIQSSPCNIPFIEWFLGNLRNISELEVAISLDFVITMTLRKLNLELLGVVCDQMSRLKKVPRSAILDQQKKELYQNLNKKEPPLSLNMIEVFFHFSKKLHSIEDVNDAFGKIRLVYQSEELFAQLEKMNKIDDLVQNFITSGSVNLFAFIIETLSQSSSVKLRLKVATELRKIVRALVSDKKEEEIRNFVESYQLYLVKSSNNILKADSTQKDHGGVVSAIEAILLYSVTKNEISLLGLAVQSGSHSILANILRMIRLAPLSDVKVDAQYASLVESTRQPGLKIPVLYDLIERHNFDLLKLWIEQVDGRVLTSLLSLGEMISELGSPLMYSLQYGDPQCFELITELYQKSPMFVPLEERHHHLTAMDLVLSTCPQYLPALIDLGFALKPQHVAKYPLYGFQALSIQTDIQDIQDVLEEIPSAELDQYFNGLSDFEKKDILYAIWKKSADMQVAHPLLDWISDRVSVQPLDLALKEQTFLAASLNYIKKTDTLQRILMAWNLDAETINQYSTCCDGQKKVFDGSSLAIAIYAQQPLEVIQFLIQKGADITAFTSDHRNLFSIQKLVPECVMQEFVNLLPLLSDETKTSLFEFHRTDSINSLEALYANCINAREYVKYFIPLINHVDAFHINTALEYQDLDTAHFLINEMIQQESVESLLQKDAKGRLFLVEYLSFDDLHWITQQSTVDEERVDLNYSLRRSKKDCLARLLTHPIKNIIHKDSQGRSFLIMAAKECYLDFVNQFLNSCDSSIFKHEDYVELFKVCMPYLQENTGYVSLVEKCLRAMSHYQPEVLQYLIEYAEDELGLAIQMVMDRLKQAGLLEKIFIARSSYQSIQDSELAARSLKELMLMVGSRAFFRKYIEYVDLFHEPLSDPTVLMIALAMKDAQSLSQILTRLNTVWVNHPQNIEKYMSQRYDSLSSLMHALVLRDDNDREGLQQSIDCLEILVSQSNFSFEWGSHAYGLERLFFIRIDEEDACTRCLFHKFALIVSTHSKQENIMTHLLAQFVAEIPRSPNLSQLIKVFFRFLSSHSMVHQIAFDVFERILERAKKSIFLDQKGAPTNTSVPFSEFSKIIPDFELMIQLCWNELERISDYERKDLIFVNRFSLKILDALHLDAIEFDMKLEGSQQKIDFIRNQCSPELMSLVVWHAWRLNHLFLRTDLGDIFWAAVCQQGLTDHIFDQNTWKKWAHVTSKKHFHQINFQIRNDFLKFACNTNIQQRRDFLDHFWSVLCSSIKKGYFEVVNVVLFNLFDAGLLDQQKIGDFLIERFKKDLLSKETAFFGTNASDVLVWLKTVSKASLPQLTDAEGTSIIFYALKYRYYAMAVTIFESVASEEKMTFLQQKNAEGKTLRECFVFSRHPGIQKCFNTLLYIENFSAKQILLSRVAHPDGHCTLQEFLKNQYQQLNRSEKKQKEFAQKYLVNISLKQAAHLDFNFNMSQLNLDSFIDDQKESHSAFSDCLANPLTMYAHVSGIEDSCCIEQQLLEYRVFLAYHYSLKRHQYSPEQVDIIWDPRTVSISMDIYSSMNLMRKNPKSHFSVESRIVYWNVLAVCTHFLLNGAQHYQSLSQEFSITYHELQKIAEEIEKEIQSAENERALFKNEDQDVVEILRKFNQYRMFPRDHDVPFTQKDTYLNLEAIFTDIQKSECSQAMKYPILSDEYTNWLFTLYCRNPKHNSPIINRNSLFFELCSGVQLALYCGKDRAKHESMKKLGVLEIFMFVNMLAQGVEAKAFTYQCSPLIQTVHDQEESRKMKEKSDVATTALIFSSKSAHDVNTQKSTQSRP